MLYNSDNIYHLLQHQFLENPLLYGIPDDDLEKKITIFIYQWVFDFFGTIGVHGMKKACLEVRVFAL